jgi:hypothetical protein
MQSHRTSIQCPLCSWSKKKGFDTHVKVVHETTIKKLWDDINGGPALCQCGCKEETQFIDWKRGYKKFVNGHNANIYSSYDVETAKKIALTRGTNWKNKPSWSLGLTKETDVRVAKRAQKTSAGRKEAFLAGKIKIWSKDLTKETDARLRQTSDTLKKMYSSEEIIPWARGLTKDTSEKVKKMSENVSLKLRQADLRKRLNELQQLSKVEIKERIERSGHLSLMDNLGSYVNDLISQILVRCRTCGTQFKGNLRKLQFGKCIECHANESNAQAEISSFVRSIQNDVFINVRDVIAPKELDIYVPSKKFAIEFNGLYWHSEKKKSSIYHSDKSNSATEKGIDLFHIFEDEWREKPEIIKSMIRHRLGLTIRSIGARECSIKELSIAQRREFFEKNHIDGDCPAMQSWGLFKDDRLVSALSLRRPFHKKYSKYLEVARFASELDTQVCGALSKLTKVAKRFAQEKGHDRGLMTYVDLRFGTGKSYAKSGWTFSNKTPNRFWWTDCTNRFNRFKFRADKKEGKTEMQIANESGVIKIWGCPNAIYFHS